MWISRQLKSEKALPTLETGCVTMNDGGDIEAVGSGVEREVSIFAPYGYAYSMPAGERMLIASIDGSGAGLGVKMNGDIAVGEIRISNPAGAYIHLKNDGSVVINGAVITAEGEVISDE